MTTLDSMDLEILRHKTTAAAEEMGLTLIRAARTIYVKEVADFAVAIGGLDGKAFAYPEALGVSAFVDLDLTTCLNAVVHWRRATSSSQTRPTPMAGCRRTCPTCN